MRTCPFHECQERLPEAMFACRKHWFSLKRPDRDKIWSAYNAYLADQMDMEELRKIQNQALAGRGQA